MYEVEYLDGERMSLAANNIAENLFAQIDDDGNRQVLMDKIIGHRYNEHAIKQQDIFAVTKKGTKRRKKQQNARSCSYGGRPVGQIG